MVTSITNPAGDRAIVPVNTSVLFECVLTAPTVQVIWLWALNGGSFTLFGNTPRVVLMTPASVVNSDGSGRVGSDQIEVRAVDPMTGSYDTRTLVLVQAAPYINHTNVAGNMTDGQGIPSTTPKNRDNPQGPGDTTVPTTTTPVDEENEPGSGWVPGCTPIQSPLVELGISGVTAESQECSCKPPMSVQLLDGTYTGSEAPANIATPGGGTSASGLVQGAPMFCASEKAASSSQAWTRPYGILQMKAGCGALITRGKPVELCTWFSNVPDALPAGERIAGTKTSFGWQARLVQDTAGNVTIYWGDRSAEGWLTSDGGATFSAPKGSFGTLTKQGDGSFTRATKDGTYYDFDAAGLIQTMKDRSENGNPVYFNYNGSGQMIRITGPGMGYRPYFGYDANGRVNAMTLESSDVSKERATYYDYDAGGRMNRVIWPENCITYFDYDGNDNLALEINPDNYRTYFTYGSETVPRLREINLPSDAAVYFTYTDAVPRHVRSQAGGPDKQYDYQWAGLPQVQVMNAEHVYFAYDANGKPVYARGTDGSETYYEWDASGQVAAMRSPLDSLQYFTYGAFGRMTSWKNSEGRTTYWNYDAHGFQTNWIDRKGAATYFERDTYGKMASRMNRRGNVTYFTYNSQGLVTSRKAADLTATYFDWNPGAEAELVIDEVGNVCYFHHDKRGRIARWKDFAGQVTDYGFDNRSNLTVMIDRRGNAWYWEYDGLSRKTVERTALLNTSYFNYSRANLLTNRVDARGYPTYFYYTAEKRLLAHETALKELTYFTYTPAGQPESVKDARGNTQYWTYDALHRQATVKDSSGNVTTFQYDPDGDQSAATDPRGNTTYLYYDEMDRLFARRNPLNHVSYFYFDAEGNQVCAEDALARRTYFYFDAIDQRYSVEDAQKNLTYYTYEQRGPTSSMKNSRGFVTYLYYDKLERQFATKDALGGVTYAEYDANSNRVASRDARGNTSYFDFDQDNRNILATTPLGETTYLGYDAAANRTSVKDALGRLSYYYFDTLNRTFCTEDAKQARTYFTFDAVGNTSSDKDPLGRVTYYYYDASNRRFATQDALGGFRYFTFDGASNNDSVKDPRANVTYLYYDALNRMHCQRSPVGGLTYYSFDAVGNRTSVKDPVARLNYFYFDTLNRQYASEDGLQKRTYFEFDAVGNTTSIKNPRRATVTPAEVGIQYFTYDGLNRRNSAKDEVAQVWYYDYDATANLAVQTNPRLARTYWEYDALNRKKSQSDPLGRTWYWTYDGVGSVSSVKDGKAQTTYYQYDAVNLLERTDFPGAIYHYFEYDNARQRTASADQTGRNEWAYDSLGRNFYRETPWFGSQSILTIAQRLYYEYDAASNRHSLKDTNSVVVYYDHDAANRIREIKSPTYGGWIAYYEYNAADQMLHEKRQNTTVTYHGYDAAGRVSLIQHRNNAGTILERLDFTRDEAGNPTRVDVGTTTPSIYTYFNYDAANRIAREAWRNRTGTNIYGFNYAYDGAGNRKHKQHTTPSTVTQYWEYDLADQLEKQRDGGAVGVYFEFDANGNLSVEHDTNASAGRTYYDYDPRNLLGRVDFPGATRTNYFYYNAIGERIRKDDNASQTLYTWDGIDVIQEKAFTSLLSVVRNVKGYAPVAGIGAYLMHGTTDVSNPNRFPLKNQVGSTIGFTGAAGTLIGTLRYDAWGQPFQASGTVMNYRFNGKEMDPDFVAFNSNNRRYHYPARTYTPFRAAFVQRDPLILRGSGRGRYLRNYLMSSSRPTLAIDPFGLLDQAYANSCDYFINDIAGYAAIYRNEERGGVNSPTPGFNTMAGPRYRLGVLLACRYIRSSSAGSARRALTGGFDCNLVGGARGEAGSTPGWQEGVPPITGSTGLCNGVLPCPTSKDVAQPYRHMAAAAAVVLNGLLLGVSIRNQFVECVEVRESCSCCGGVPHPRVGATREEACECQDNIAEKVANDIGEEIGDLLVGWLDGDEPMQMLLKQLKDLICNPGQDCAARFSANSCCLLAPAPPTGPGLPFR